MFDSNTTSSQAMFLSRDTGSPAHSRCTGLARHGYTRLCSWTREGFVMWRLNTRGYPRQQNTRSPIGFVFLVVTPNCGAVHCIQVVLSEFLPDTRFRICFCFLCSHIKRSSHTLYSSLLSELLRTRARPNLGTAVYRAVLLRKARRVWRCAGAL